MLVHHWVTLSIKFISTHLYTRLERGAVKVKCLAQEHNTMFLARAPTRTAYPGWKQTCFCTCGILLLIKLKLNLNLNLN